MARTGVKVVARGLLWSLVDVSLADPADRDDGTPTEPVLSPLIGADPAWTPAHEGQAAAGLDYRWVRDDDGGWTPEFTRRCSACKAVYSGGTLLDVEETTYDADGRPVTTRRPSGIREGDPWICLCCGSVSPSNARRIRSARPRPSRSRPVPRGTNRLRRKERLALLRQAEGPACLALIDARDSGRAEEASRIERAFAMYQAGELDLAELHARAGTEPRVDPRTRSHR